jgi:MFS family permease
VHLETDATFDPLQTEKDTPGWQYAVASGILGWVLDAFDFFVVVFLFNDLMARFHVGKPAIVWTLTLTLAMRPVGALIFGSLADRFGRKKPLIACVIFFSASRCCAVWRPPIRYSLSCVGSMALALAWAGTGASALRMQWRARLASSVAFYRA